jgi:hypothetical protein
MGVMRFQTLHAAEAAAITVGGIIAIGGDLSALSRRGHDAQVSIAAHRYPALDPSMLASPTPI